MNNEMVKRETTALSNEVLSEWGAPTVSTQDIIIPKILTMQGLSIAVAEGRAQMGEFRDSLNNAKIGDITAPFECIPFYLEKCWDVQEEQPTGEFKWVRTIPVVESPSHKDYNDNWNWEDTVNGVKVKRIRRFNFYVLLPSEIENNSSIPYVFSFKSSSLKEGKKLYTQMYMRNVRAGVPPAAHHVLIGGIRQKNDKGIFIVPTFSVGIKSTERELTECLSWIKMIKGGKTRMDESDVIDTSGLELETVGTTETGEY